MESRCRRSTRSVASLPMRSQWTRLQVKPAAYWLLSPTWFICPGAQTSQLSKGIGPVWPCSGILKISYRPELVHTGLKLKPLGSHMLLSSLYYSPCSSDRNQRGCGPRAAAGDRAGPEEPQRTSQRPAGGTNGHLSGDAAAGQERQRGAGSK